MRARFSFAPLKAADMRFSTRTSSTMLRRVFIIGWRHLPSSSTLQSVHRTWAASWSR